ncbi:MAG: hypothetical protein HKM22_05960 [Gammaproteobacteria bacterium]|nr:hypothetical protein [Gammaproteobacteria bacterium]
MLSIISILAAVFLGFGFFAFLEDGSSIHPLLGDKDFATILIAVGVLLMVFEFQLLFKVIKIKRAAQEQNNN